MTKRSWVIGVSAGLVLAAATAGANNVAVTNVVLQSPAGGTAVIRFDLSWDNSWHDPVNFDACWVFAKYSTDAGVTWSHATLAAAGTNPAAFSAGSFPGLQVVVPSDRKGAVFQRTVDGNGTVATTNANLVWTYTADGVSSNAAAKVRVFALEMVYIPTGSFKLGGVGTEPYHFYQVAVDGSSSTPYAVTSEAAILVTNSVGNLWAGGDISSGILSNSYPKGYAAFYMQKMGMSRRQFTDFVNTLTAQQQDQMTRFQFNKTNNKIKGTADPQTGVRAFFGTDANGNAGPELAATQSLLNETNDAEWWQVRDMTAASVRSYMDWAALRPLTELEWEKAGQGPLDPVTNAYAWGTANLADTSAWSNRQTAAEVPSSGNRLS